MANTAAKLQHVVEILSSWQYRAVAILSLTAHLFLVVFSGIRRREADGCLRKFLWFAYQLTDWAPTYVLGNLYLETKPREKLIVAFWLPFLLLHLALPDNIRAYAMEDNELSLRTILFVYLQSLGAIYVWIRYLYMDCTAGLLRQASGIMFFLGIFKYVESTVVLWRGDLGRIRKSCEKQQSRYCDDYKGGERLKLDDEKALLVAHDLFDVCKRAFCDYPVDENLGTVAKSVFVDEWENMCKVVEMELSLMYDILYTKAAVIHTWGGYAIRVASPFLTAAALVLFRFHCTEGQEIEDIYITYILLGTTLFLDVKWLLSALASTWTHSFFKARSQCLFNHEVLCRGRWQQLRRFVVSLDYLSRRLISLGTCAKEPKSYRMWSGTFGQHNLLYECSGNRRSRYSRLVKKIKSKDHSRGLEIPDLVKELLFENICRKFFPDPEEEKRKKNSRSAGSTNPWQQARLVLVEEADHWKHDHACFTYDQVAPPDLQCHAGFTCDIQVAPPDPKEQADHCRPCHAGCMYDPAAPPDKGMGSPPELQEVIVMWHIATDIFWHTSNTAATVPPKYMKAIKAMSDYMVFLMALRPNMLPNLKLRSQYDNTRNALKRIIRCKKAPKANEKELAMWMLRNKDDLLKGPGTILLWEGTQHADGLRRLLRGEQYRDQCTKEFADTMKRLVHWIPELEDFCPESSTEDLLKFILDSWVRLLIYASIKCSREAHAKQLSRGGELTTAIWIITEHADIIDVKKNCPLFFI